MLQRQFDAVADQRLTGQQFIHRRVEGRAKGGDQPDAGGVAPDQHRRARHQISLDPLAQHHAVIAPRRLFHQPFEITEPQIRVGQSMGEIKDRIVLRLPVDPAEDQLAGGRQGIEHHGTGLVDRGQLRRVAKQHQRREYFLQIRELAVIQHRAFIDKRDIERVFAAFPAKDEIRAAQASGGQRAGDRLDRVIEQLRAVQCRIGQPLHHRAVAVSGQPFGDLFIFGVIDRGIENAVDGGGGHPLVAQHRRRLVGGRQNGQRAAVLAPPPLIIARHGVNARFGQRLGQCCQQHGLARPGLAHHGQNRWGGGGFGGQGALRQADPTRGQHLGHAVERISLIVGKLYRGQGHGVTIASPAGRCQ